MTDLMCGVEVCLVLSLPASQNDEEKIKKETRRKLNDRLDVWC